MLPGSLYNAGNMSHFINGREDIDVFNLHLWFRSLFFITVYIDGDIVF